MSTNMRFDGREKKTGSCGETSFKFPAGEIPLSGSLDQIREKFIKRGFDPKIADEILFRLFVAVSTEPAITSREIQQGLFKLIGTEVGK